MKIIGDVWKEVGRIVAKRPTVALPFLIAGLINAIALYILYLAPQHPVSALLAPPIRVYFGEQFLHYPANFLLLPRLFYAGEMVIDAFFGMFMFCHL